MSDLRCKRAIQHKNECPSIKNFPSVYFGSCFDFGLERLSYALNFMYTLCMLIVALGARSYIPSNNKLNQTTLKYSVTRNNIIAEFTKNSL